MKKIFILSFLFILIITGCSTGKSLTPEQAKVKATDFINKNLMSSGNEVSVKEVTEEYGMYKVVVNIPNGEEVISYISKDGEKFFPQVLDIKEVESKSQEQQPDAANNEAASAPPVTQAPKSDKPNIELFVMSHCPFGTQVEKGLLPVLKTLGDKVDFELKFCDYSMHGEAEVKEELNQNCIQREEPEKLTSYLGCFLADGNSNRCLSEVGINTSKVNACVAKIDDEFKVMEMFNDKSTWLNGRYAVYNVNKDSVDKYGVQGSPTLVINGEKISSGRDSASLLKAVCGAFNDAPSECNEELSSAQPSSGFGYNETGSSGGGGGDCGA